MRARSCSAGVTPGPEIVTTKSTVSGARAAARSETHPPWLMPHRPTPGPTPGSDRRTAAAAMWLVCAILERLLAPVPRRAAATRLVVAQHDRAAIGDPLGPPAPLVLGSLPGAVDEDDARRTCPTRWPPHDAGEVAGARRDDDGLLSR